MSAIKSYARLSLFDPANDGGRKMAFRLRTLLLLTLLIALLTGAPAGGYAHSTSPEPGLPAQTYKAGELLVKFAPVTAFTGGQASALGTLQRYSAERVETLGRLQIERWRVPEGRELEIAALLSALPGVEYAEPDYEVHIHIVPNDTLYAQQWAHPKINSPAAWDITTGDSSVIVAILDTGVDLNHPEFQGRLVAGFNSAGGSANDDHDPGHGTHVAGIIAAAGNNGIGVAGMAWQVRIMPIKVLDASGRGTHSGIALGMDWAIERGARILNLSLGGTGSSSTLQNAVQRAHNAGVLVIASAGNCGGTNFSANGCTSMNQPVYPAAYDQVVAVAATDSLDNRASYSNQGSYVDIAAPGSSILSTTPGGQYGNLSGTSQAAPYVSGLAALLWSVDPGRTANEVKRTIQNTAVDLGSSGYDIAFGHGRINALAALATTPLAAPILYEVSNLERDGQYTLDWSDVPQATSYTLEEDDNAAFTTPAVVYTGANSQAALTERETGTWYYRVRAVQPSSGTLGPWSNVVSVAVGLDAPLLLAIDNAGQRNYRVTWGSVTGATGYRLQEAASLSFDAAKLYTTTHSFLEITAESGGTWHYRVQAYTTGGSMTSPWSNVRSVQVVADAPAWITITRVDEDAYTLSWAPVQGATGYRVVEAAGPAEPPTTRYEGTATTYHVTGQRSGRWTYGVRAFNAAGDGPATVSEEITVTMPSVPIPAIKSFHKPNRETTYTIEWESSEGATQYTLEESRTPWFDTPQTAYTGPLTAYVISDQPVGRWYYRVRTHFVTGQSPWSASVDVLVAAEIYLPLILR
jgi:subtilisin family serine protease